MATTGRSSKTRSGSTGTRRKTAPKRAQLSSTFAPDIWHQATEIAARYRIVLAFEEGLGYVGRTAEMPYVTADDRDEQSCLFKTREATAAAIAALLTEGDKPPLPAADAKRDQQVNIRVSSEEKERLETAATQAGFRSVSDFIRTAGLDRAG